MIRVLIADDHAILREGLRKLLADEAGIQVVGEASSGTEAVERAKALKADVVLMDLVMPGLDGIEALRRIRAASPSTQVVILSSYADDEKVKDAVAAGAIGYLLKDVVKADILRAIKGAVQGQPSLHPEAQRHLMKRVLREQEPPQVEALTPREREILGLLGRGQSNKGIAAQLGLTEGTVKGYVSAVLAKLGLEDRTQAALYAVEHGLVQK